jgi:hypothetical protein
MSAWSFFVDVVGVTVTTLLVVAVGWAASERGQIHREWVRLRRAVRWKVDQSVDWCMAMAAAAGCA